MAARSDAEIPVLVTCLASIDTAKAVSNREVFPADHHRDLELIEALTRHRHTDESAAKLRHEVDGLRGDFVRCDRQVAFVLAVLVVDDNDHLTVLDRVDGLSDRRERSLPTGDALRPAPSRSDRPGWLSLS